MAPIRRGRLLPLLVAVAAMTLAAKWCTLTFVPSAGGRLTSSESVLVKGMVSPGAGKEESRTAMRLFDIGGQPKKPKKNIRRGQLPWYEVLAFDLGRLPWFTITTTTLVVWFIKTCLDTGEFATVG
mmetsp:Transcript_67229/g.161103  ORF Transcript_67229/g.161103 Transcript_67229/m.161103 type:complete len:126 (-) Transcript_67229:153-530(-)